MKKRILPLVAVLLLAGCTHRYVIRTTNGSSIDTTSKPKLKNGFYVYKDALGREQTIHTGRVSEISAASLAKKNSDSFNFLPGSQGSK